MLLAFTCVLQLTLKTIWWLLKKQHRFSMWSSNTIPRDIPEGMQFKLLEKHMHTCVCSTIYNIQGMETAKMPWKGQKDQENIVFISKIFYSVTKKNETLSFTTKWMELENIILSEVSQVQNGKNCMFSFICRFITSMPISLQYLLCIVNFKLFSEARNDCYIDIKKIFLF
jgi:hypothetical protein